MSALMLITGIGCIFAEVSEWQTSKIQVLVSATLVRVQVPSSALAPTISGAFFMGKKKVKKV